MFYVYFTAKLLTFHSTKVISLGGRWSDSKGSVINANDTPSFPLFMLSSASAVVLPYPHSRWKVIHLLCLSFIFYLLGPEKYTVTIHLNENHLVVIITLHRKPLHGAARQANLNEKKRNLMR